MTVSALRGLAPLPRLRPAHVQRPVCGGRPQAAGVRGARQEEEQGGHLQHGLLHPAPLLPVHRATQVGQSMQKSQKIFTLFY